MSHDLVALLAGAALAVAALAYVLYPLFVPHRQPPAVVREWRKLNIDDDIERRVQALRSRNPACPACGVRPESDAEYCSHCGRQLPASAR